MIDFKYHVVSIVAVFLALAVGIVLGTNVLSGDVLKNLKTQTSDLRKQAQDLRTQNQQQQDSLSGNENFLQAIEPMAVAGRLTGERVVVVTTPDAPKSIRDHAVKILADAGASVTAQVDVDTTYDDPAHAMSLDELLQSLGPPTFDPTPAGDVSAKSAAMVAAALVGTPAATGSVPAPGGGAVASSSAPSSPTPSASKTAGRAKSSATTGAAGTGSPPATPSVTPADERTVGPPASRPLDATSVEVLAGLSKAGFLKFDKQPQDYADMVVIVSAAAPTKGATPSPSSGPSLLDLIAALQRDGSQTVVVGPVGSADPGGLVGQVRGDSSLAKVVSAVDNADSEAGLIAMVLALDDETDGTAGQYGTGQGAQAPAPTALPLSVSSAVASGAS